jgi:hypothetical protein
MFVDYDIKGVPLCSFEVATKIGMTVIPYSALDPSTWLKAVGYEDERRIDYFVSRSFIQ